MDKKYPLAYLNDKEKPCERKKLINFPPFSFIE